MNGDMEMQVRLTDRYEIRTFDRLNLCLWELKEVDVFDKPKQQGGKRTGEKREEWVRLEAYFPDLQSAVVHVYGRMQRDLEYAGDLAGAVDELRAIAAELREAVAR